MKYKITLGGRGADFYIHKLDDDKKKLLIEGQVDDVIETTLDYNQICEIMNVEYLEDAPIAYTGIYDGPDNLYIKVIDENDNVVFDSTKSDDEWYFDTDIMEEYYNYESVCEDEDGDYLFVEEYCKGPFFEFVLESEDFNSKLLTPEKLEINDQWDLITGLYYKGNKIKDMELGDYRSKGIYYHLN